MSPTASTSYVTYVPEKIVCTTERCGAMVRWNEGILEQVWEIHHIGTTGAIEEITNEWRPVPGSR
jgi:hypothetical protein